MPPTSAGAEWQGMADITTTTEKTGGATVTDDERKQLAAELLPHLATIMRLTRPAAGTVQAWLKTANILQITLKNLIDEVQRQERQEGRP
jgi:hypothetical protein